MSKRSLSVVLPTYNCAPLMPRHLASMDAWADLADEIIVVDSRSTDGTLELIRARLRHPNIRIIERDRGLYESWNEGIAATTGDWVYISTAGDTIEREQLLHLHELGERANADVVISPPRFVDENGVSLTDMSWPTHKIIANHSGGRPFTLSRMAAGLLAFIHCPSSVLGSSASNLYRGEALRSRPFACNFRGAGDTVWMMRNALSLCFCLTPTVGSAFCVHPKDDKKMPHAEAHAFMLSFSDEKSALARSISDAYPGQEWSALSAESSLFANTRNLIQKRRSELASGKSNPLRLIRWFGLTATFMWQRIRLSVHRRDISTRLIAKSLADTRHFQPVS